MNSVKTIQRNRSIKKTVAFGREYEQSDRYVTGYARKECSIIPVSALQ